MVLQIDPSSGEPVYGQIAQQLRAAIADGRLREGAALPAVRTVAADLGVNLNTVARAYRQLAEEGFVQIRDRSRAVVLGPPPSSTVADRRRLGAALGDLLGRMRQAGLAPDELRQVFEAELKRLKEG